MAKTDIWMPLFIGDYLADTRRLTTEQHGAYMLLIMDYWRNGPPPDDASVLANITGMSAAAWKKSGSAVLAFFTLNDGHWTHDRIDRELEAAKEGKRTAHDKATRAAKARWGKKTSINAPSNPASSSRSSPQALHEECPSPSPSPSGTSNSTPSVPSEPTAAPSPVKPADVIFANGIPLLTASGVSEKNARSMLGLMRKQHGDEAVVLAIERCVRESPIEPVAWLQAALTPTTARRSKQAALEERNRAAAAEFVRMGETDAAAAR